MSKTKVISFANNKGGSGKSTTCSNVGYGLTLLGKRVLLVDGDMQLNLSLSFFPEEEVLEMAKSEKNLFYGICKGEDLESYIVPTPYENLDLIPSSILMSGIEVDLFTMWQREFILKQGLAKIRESGYYDYILIDAPPTLGCWVMNIMCASDYLIIPVEASPWGLFGPANLFEFYEKLERLAPDLKIMGVVVTKANERKNQFKQAIDVLGELDNVRLFDTYIRIDSAIEWSQENSLPVMAYKKSSRAAQEYLTLSKEVMEYAHR